MGEEKEKGRCWRLWKHALVISPGTWVRRLVKWFSFNIKRNKRKGIKWQENQCLKSAAIPNLFYPHLSLYLYALIKYGRKRRKGKDNDDDILKHCNRVGTHSFLVNSLIFVSCMSVYVHYVKQSSLFGWFFCFTLLLAFGFTTSVV